LCLRKCLFRWHSENEFYDRLVSKKKEFYDSDFNAEEGDDDLFAYNVDKYVDDHNETEIWVEHEGETPLRMTICVWEKKIDKS
jgi:hypothetical protein